MIVLWRVTERCNLACGFCAYDRRLPGIRLEAQSADVKRFAGLLGAYQQVTGTRVLVSWLGGEPLLWEPLFPLPCSSTKPEEFLHAVLLPNLTVCRLLPSSQWRISCRYHGDTVDSRHVDQRLFAVIVPLPTSSPSSRCSDGTRWPHS